MPQVPAQRSLISNAAGGSVFLPGTQTLQSSGDSSSCEFADWFLHLQTMGGMWQRYWVYSPTPTLGASNIASGCPSIEYSYCDVNWWGATDDRVVRASFCSGAASAMDIDYASDESFGGFGVSGTFWTATAGYYRRKALASDPKAEASQQQGNTETSRIPGPYLYSSAFDSSATFATDFQRVIQDCAQSLEFFDPTLVTI
tara:strand:+ start:176 stop:775 length:600 start_codon:yes stop_codon:yes gene_type:complete